MHNRFTCISVPSAQCDFINSRSITRDTIPEENLGSTSRRSSWLPRSVAVKRQLTKEPALVYSPSPSSTEDEASTADDEDIEFLMKAGF